MATKRPVDPVHDFIKWKKKHESRKKAFRKSRQTAKQPQYIEEDKAIKLLADKYSTINAEEIANFSDFPLSSKTLKGLQDAGYCQPTEIQRKSIGPALCGRDILGAAKTGSGKTLAFLIPILECLFRKQWTREDGLGILIISPTRELALQTYTFLCKVGKKHEFSAGLVIGGKDLKQEMSCIHHTNIVICTPGRLLQHFDQTTYFYASNLLMLVLDEADRILDLGFASTMNAIVENLPKERQTLLYSATQTKSVRDLARLSLHNPEYVWVHEKAKYSTPATLDQNYVVCELPQKINMLYSFLRSHVKKKIMVFFTSCKQVQYLYYAFCRLRPGLPVMALHGKQQQMKRIEVYQEFCQRPNAVLFATDIAARGLDFPAVNWVLQLDCPEDANTYIHRAGRTARYKEGGESLLVLLPSEEPAMVTQLKDRKVPINKIEVNPKKLLDVQSSLEEFLVQDTGLKERAQRCFSSYIRAIFLMRNKEVFDVKKLPLDQYAFSLGLAVAPHIRFLQKAKQQVLHKEGIGKKNDTETGEEFDIDKRIETFCDAFAAKQEHCNRTLTSWKSSPVPSLHQEEEGEDGELSREEPLSDGKAGGCHLDDESSDDDDLSLFTVKQLDMFGARTAVNKQHQEEEEGKSGEKEEDEKKKKQKKSKGNYRIKEAKKLLKKKLKVNTKITFDEGGEVAEAWPPIFPSNAHGESEDDGVTGIDITKAKKRMSIADKIDKEEYRRKIKEKHKKQRFMVKEARRARSGQQQKEDKDEESESDDSETSDAFVLPDADGCFVRTSDEDSQDSSNRGQGSNISENEEDKGDGDSPVPPKKRGRLQEEETEEDDASLDTGLSLAEDEALVLELLRRK
uniref:ATP-dependent RNA helicase n=1 Tax=Eptatretus burgeri TaxID=7764 RepID=A0A8C4WUX3_EPTBU